jgi:signal transduction histidine kinase
VNHLDDPAINALVGNFRNITQRKKAEQQQQQLERQKDEFIAICSHELKTPLTSIKAYTHILTQRLRELKDAQSVEFLQKLDTQVNRLSGVVGDLLDATEIDSIGIRLQMDEFDLNELVVEVVEEVKQSSAEHVFTFDLATPQRVYGDKKRIGQVVENLLTNAIKYSPRGGGIEVATEKREQAVVVSVKDYGIGIPEPQQERIFDRFFRVSGDQQRTFPGLGLGLYISAEIVRRHSGDIWVESEEGKGSVFSFSLPTKNVG